MKKWSAMHIGVHILGWIPLGVLIAAYFTNHLTVNPIQAAEQRTGDIAIIMLLLSLACTPLNTLFGVTEFIRLRRPLGLYAFFYASLHLVLYAGVDYGFDFSQIASTFNHNLYLWAGLGGLIILIPLAVTSVDWWKKRLGKTWKILHRFVYLAAILAVVHLALVVKGDFGRLIGDILKPLIALTILALLLIARIPPIRKTLSRVRFLRRSRQIERGKYAVKEKIPLPESPKIRIKMKDH